MPDIKDTVLALGNAGYNKRAPLEDAHVVVNTQAMLGVVGPRGVVVPDVDVMLKNRGSRPFVVTADGQRWLPAELAERLETQLSAIAELVSDRDILPLDVYKTLAELLPEDTTVEVALRKIDPT